jgi:hypothetical protein
MVTLKLSLLKLRSYQVRVYAQSLDAVIYFNGSTDYIELTAYTGNPTSQGINSAGAGTWIEASLIVGGGTSGSAGTSGSSGSSGTTGTSGTSGITGPQGPQGPNGPQGATGPQGAIGPQGIVGPQGTGGSSGTAGTSGSSGTAGTSGSSGTAGTSGSAGTSGGIGPQGNQGPIGPQGNVGPQGVGGPQGNTGPAGSSGTSGSAGTSGGIGPQGNQGPQGVQGPSGSSGTSGGIGPQGNQGPQGNAGPQGSTGPQGPTGPQGSTGPQGPAGPQGNQGPSGSSGTSGNSGSSGTSGNSGSSGTSGGQGPGGSSGTSGTSPANQVSGTGTSGQVTFWTGTTTQAGDNNLFWNNTDKRLGVGKAGADARFEVYAGTKPQIRSNGGTAMGGGIEWYTELSGADRRNWAFLSEDDIAGDFNLLRSSAAGGSPSVRTLTFQRTGVAEFKSDLQTLGKLGASDNNGLFLRGNGDTTHKLYYKASGDVGIYLEINNTFRIQYYNSGTQTTPYTFSTGGNFNANGIITGNRFVSSATDNGSGEYYFFTGNGAVSNNLTIYAYSNNVYTNAYGSYHIRANNTGGTGGAIFLHGGSIMLGTANAPALHSSTRGCSNTRFS